MLSVDRMICVVFPFKFNTISNRKFVFGIIFGIIVFQLILNSTNLLFNISIVPVWNPLTNLTQNVKLCTATSLIVSIRDISDELLRSVIPFCIQFMSSSILAFTLVKKRRAVNENATFKREKKFAITVLCLNMFFFITQIPVFASTIYLFLAGANKSILITTRQAIVAYFIYLITVLGASFNLLLVFFINLAANRIYRNEFCNLLGSIYRLKFNKIFS
jgi:hypothetical protein